MLCERIYRGSCQISCYLIAPWGLSVEEKENIFFSAGWWIAQEYKKRTGLDFFENIKGLFLDFDAR